MNLFQYLTLPITIALLIWSFYNLVFGSQSRKIALLGTIVWANASLAILRPDLTIQVASFLGIGRGADLILYLLVITYLISMFYIYQRFQRMEANITKITRHIAIQNVGKPQGVDERNLTENIDIYSS
jgi:small membrane protein